ncbi:MAG: SusD/RagB family nutrient-binding outer membrane lipoprotein [Bacteroidota bacterium]
MIKYIKVIFMSLALFLASCQNLVDDINDNPNDILITDIDAELFLTGAMLANSVAQGGHLARIGAMYSGQLVGLSSLYSNIYGFSLSTAESVATWSRYYVGTIPNLRHIRNIAPNDRLIVGIAKVLEAHAIGTAASLFGDIPYTEINNPDISDPVFDDQESVFNAMIALLEDASGDLGATNSRSLPADIYFEGDAQRWVEAANTLKARYHLQMKDYAAAYAAAQNGISDGAGSMQFKPRGDASISSGDKNLFWEILEGSRAGDIGTANSYMIQLLDTANTASRNNAKTNEGARLGYYSIDPSGGSANSGVIEQFEPQNLVSYAENQLILAEAGARTNGFATGLGHLNELRAWLNTGAMVNANFNTLPIQYDAYEDPDFEAGGMENADGIDKTRALIREIIEERYISGFLMYMPYNDARRLRASDSDVAVPYILVDGPNPPYPERMPYSDDELNSNENAPSEDPGIFTKTKVNQ